MKFLDYRGERFISVADIVNWLATFAQELEDGEFPGCGSKEGQLIWNIVSGLVEQDLTAKAKRE